MKEQSQAYLEYPSSEARGRAHVARLCLIEWGAEVGLVGFDAAPEDPWKVGLGSFIHG